MRVLSVHPEHPDPAQIENAADMIRSGGLVAFPTETVYGLGADALNAEAVAGIFAAKGRPAWNPVIVHVPSIEKARSLTDRWPDDATILAQNLWPGPITIVLRKSLQVPDIVTAGLQNVGIRIPAHPVALALLEAADRPIAAPSANRFSEVSPTTAAHVIRSLGDRPGIVLDGGPCDVGIESTVIDLSGEIPCVLRPGMVTRDRLEQLLGRQVDYRRSDDSQSATAGEAQPSPGTAARHYAPRADVWLFESADVQSVQSALSLRLDDATTGALHVRALLIHVGESAIPGRIERRRMADTPGLYARTLYRELHAADDDGVGLLLIELPPSHDAWSAVRDRLTRASR